MPLKDRLRQLEAGEFSAVMRSVYRGERGEGEKERRTNLTSQKLNA